MNVDKIYDVKALSAAEIPFLLDYWYQSPPEYIYALGADINLFPKRSDFETMLLKQISTPYPQKKGMAHIWLENGKPIGHNNVNQIIFGKQANMHLHIWEASLRQKGIGTTLLKLSIPNFFSQLKLEMLFCEPNAHNIAPNRTLAKLGFHFIKTHVIVPGSINYKQEVNQWVLKKEDINFQ
jgi:RimJ/RimL family protein N-acetyltransferase